MVGYERQMFVLGEKRVFLVADRIGLERNRNEERLDAAPGNTVPLRRFVRIGPIACSCRRQPAEIPENARRQTRDLGGDAAGSPLPAPGYYSATGEQS